MAAAGAAAVLTSGAGGGGGTTYDIVFDNAFGLTPGVDLKVGGVRAGSVKTLDVERRTSRAVVTVEVQKTGFGSFRRDAFCEIRPQSLIGEYFVDCQPGRDGRELEPGGTIPVERTATAIPADLVQNVLTRPYRERLALVFNELGAGLSARGPELNETIRRAVPALRETRKLLKVLADNTGELNALTRNSAAVLDRLADRREDVGRFVEEARDSARAAANRRGDLATSVNRLPGFLAELEPTLADLSTTAQRQTPALADLSASAPRLETFFDRLGPFADSARPAVKSLGEAAVIGRQAAQAAGSTVSELRKLTTNSTELARNLAIVLEHLNDRSFAVEKDADSPGGQGYTGLEALLQYPFDQAHAINLFDKRGYWLKLAILVNDCSPYANARTARSNPDRTRRCFGGLGPNQPGVTTPDPTATRGERTRSRRRGDRDRDEGEQRPEATATPAPGGGNDGAAPAPSLPEVPRLPALPEVDQILDQLPTVPGVGKRTDEILDYLFGP